MYLVRKSFNNVFIIVTLKSLPAVRASEYDFHSLFESHSSVASCSAIEELVLFLIVKASFEYSQNLSLLALDETFKLIRLYSPTKDKPSSLFISKSGTLDNAVIVEFEECFSNIIQFDTSFIKQLIISSLSKFV